MCLSRWQPRTRWMEQAQILASYAGTVVQLLEAGILTREQAVKEMREMGNGLGMLQGNE